MLNSLSNRLRSIVSRKLISVLRKLECLTNAQWHGWPFGHEPSASKEEYLRLAKEVRKLTFPEIDEYEQKTGFAICAEWLHDLALHTQVVIKESPLCYAHGRVLYTALSQYLSELQATSSNESLTIWETGTAREVSRLYVWLRR